MTDAPTEHDVLPIAEAEPAAEEPQRTKAWLWIAIGVVLGVAVAALLVRVGEDEQTPEQRFAAIPAALDEAESFAFELRTTTDSGGMSLNLDMDGVVDVANQRGRATMELLGKEVELVNDGDAAYVKVPAEARSFSQGKAWLKLPTSGLTPGAGLSSDPLSTLRGLAAPGATIEEVGEEEVRGTDTTHFRTRLDLTKNLPADATQGAPAGLFEQLKDVPVDVWLDDENRPRRYSFDLDVSAQSQAASTTVFLEAFDYGEPVEIDVPDPSEVAEGDVSGLGALFGGGGS